MQCLRALTWCFSEDILRDQDAALFFAGAIEDMELHILTATADGIKDPESMREHLPLDSAPFRHARRYLVKNVSELPKDDELRLACQALFLFLLRPRLTLKYRTAEDFLCQYPEARDRTAVEQDRLRHTANWMDLIFYTLQPRNNKTFALTFIPRLVEGRHARYITGSGQTKPTADRVNIFRLEGNCEKIKRPPRRRKEDITATKKTSISSEEKAGPSPLGMNLALPLPLPAGYQWMQYNGFPAALPLGMDAQLHNAALLQRLSAVAPSVHSYWAGSSAIPPVGPPASANEHSMLPAGDGFTVGWDSSSAVQPSSTNASAPVLGKRKLAEHRSADHYGSGGGLDLLFAAVSSIESAQALESNIQ